MPSTYAHRRFGADVLDRLPAELQEKIAPYRELYDIGLHGPDLLFYYHAAKSTPVSALGNAMHEQPGAVFFERARGVVNKAKNRDAALAYALGFLCHFALDSTCHPRVEQDVRDSGVSHCEIETEFDNMLLRRDGKDPLHFLTASHIHPSMEAVGRYEGLHGLVANPQPNPACAESCEQLDALYQKALPLAERLILEYRDTLQTGAPLDQAYQHTFGEN